MELTSEKLILRQPIVTVCGHVDHGKSSILDAFRGSSFQKEEAGGITQKISFTNYPSEQIRLVCSLIDKNKINLEIPGFLFIDTPGHAAFTNLRKRGGALADLVILVVSIKEGIKPQTAEVIQILKVNKTPFLVALNKIDTISGWKHYPDLKESINNQAVNVKQEFEESLLTFQGSLKEHGFDSDLFYDVVDFTKKIAIVPCSARTKEGIPELMFALCGLSQRFLRDRLKLSKETKGIILEVKKEKGMEYAEAILYDGILEESDEILIGSFSDSVDSKVRAIQQILPLINKYTHVKSASAAAGIRIQLSNKEDILSGMPFQKFKTKSEMELIKVSFSKELSDAIKTDKQGIVIRADSLGSLEALISLLKQENLLILKAGIGPIGKSDINSAKGNLEINPLDAIVVGFNVSLDEGVSLPSNVRIFTNDVIYKLIEDLQKWRAQRQEEIEKEKIMGLATICKIQILPEYIFRNSNPAIFGVKVLGGKARVGLLLIDERGEEVARIKSLELDKSSLNESHEGQELAMALPGIAFDRKLKNLTYLYSNISAAQFKAFIKQKSLLSSSEIKILQEIAEIKRRTDENWGI